MGIFGTKKKKGSEEEIAVAVGTALHLEMSETAAAITAALHIHNSGGKGRLTIKRNVNSPWRDINRALSMNR